jgi:hypothetical protein
LCWLKGVFPKLLEPQLPMIPLNDPLLMCRAGTMQKTVPHSVF